VPGATPPDRDCGSHRARTDDRDPHGVT